MNNKMVLALIIKAVKTGQKKLNLSGHQIKQIPLEITELKDLTELNLSRNQIKQIPPEIAGLKNLTILNLSGNQIKQIPPEMAELKNLTMLNLFRNQIKQIPPEMAELKNLTILNLSGNQIKQIPSEIVKLKNLTILNLSGNQIKQIPSEMAGLKNLTILNLSGNQIKQIPPEMAGLKNLTKLYLSGNQIKQIPSEMAGLKNLTELYLSGNHINQISSEMAGLKNLTILHLSGNHINQISSEIAGLKNLTILNLSGNQIKQIPPEIVNLPIEIRWEGYSFENGVIIENNPLEKPPIEIRRQGKEAIIEYLKSIQEDRLPLNEVKVLLVGDGGAGKTSLVNRMVYGKFNQNESQTDGISINNWTFRDGNEKIKTNVWDFGGQEIMHATHQFFLSERSLYILVLDSRKDEKTEYWLKHIESFGGNSPIMVVMNKIDETPSFDVNQKFLKEKYPAIKGFYKISCKKRKGVENLKSDLKLNLSNIEHIKKTWPKSWFEVKEWMENLDDPYIAYEEFERVCKQNNIENEKSQNILVSFLHDLGIVLNFRDLELFGTQVLNPRWITEGVYRIINSQILADSNGILKLEDLDSILKKKEKSDYDYPRSLYAYIINLMKKFELCYELNNCYEQDSKAVLIPQLLSVSEPDFKFNYDTSLKFILDYDEFLPPSVVPRFIVKMNEDIKNDFQWKTGVILEYPLFDSIAIVKADADAKKIYVDVNGKQKRDYFAVILANFREINRSFTNLKVIEKVPMPDNPEVTVTYEHLVRLENKGINEYLPDGSDKAYNVSELRGNIAVKTENEHEILDILKRLKTQSDTELTLLEKIIDVLCNGEDTEIKATIRQKVWDSLSLEPGAFGVTVDLKNVAKHIKIAIDEKKKK